MDKKRIKKEFQSDPTYLFNIGQYFSNHRDILKDNGVDKATLVMWQHEAINKSDQMTRDFLDSKRKPVERITGLFDLSLNGYYMPNRDTLTRSVETLELIAKSENKEYWDILFIYDEADKKGSSAHNVAVNDLMIDYEIFEKLWPPQDAGLIISEPGRFGGLLPYLFNHGFQDLYKKAFSIITRKLRENFVEMISIAISLLHFSALHDKENFLVVKTIFEDAKRNPSFKHFDWNGKLKDICRIVTIRADKKEKTFEQIINSVIPSNPRSKV